MKHIKLYEQFKMTPLYEEVNLIMESNLSDSEIDALIEEGLFNWLKGLFSNPKKKRELDKLAEKLVKTRVEIVKIDIEQENVKELQAELSGKNDIYTDSGARLPRRTSKDPMDIKKSQLESLEKTIIDKMDEIGKENEKLQKYVNKVKLDSRIESTEQAIKLADAQIKRVLSKLHKKDKKASAAINKELQAS